MNYLAHVLLARPTPASRLGALLGDFAQGLDLQTLPPEVRASLLEHRAIDHFVDHHPAVIEQRRRFAPELRRYAGILLDVFYDHFLVRHWPKLVTHELSDVTASLYGAFQTHADLLPPRLARTAPYMARDDWLGSYGEARNIERALHGISRRMRRPARLVDGMLELRRRDAELEEHFLALFPEVQEFVRQGRSALT